MALVHAPGQLFLDLGPLPEQVEIKRRSAGRHATAEWAWQDSVTHFHRALGLHVQGVPRADSVPPQLRDLRVALVQEEVDELRDAVSRSDIVKIADALADITYVAIGAAVTFGIDLAEVLAEVHRSNMTKLGPDGRPILREDGKVMKPPTYSPPDIRSVLFPSIDVSA